MKPTCRLFTHFPSLSGKLRDQRLAIHRGHIASPCRTTLRLLHITLDVSLFISISPDECGQAKFQLVKLRGITRCMVSWRSVFPHHQAIHSGTRIERLQWLHQRTKTLLSYVNKVRPLCMCTQFSCISVLQMASLSIIQQLLNPLASRTRELTANQWPYWTQCEL